VERWGRGRVLARLLVITLEMLLSEEHTDLAVKIETANARMLGPCSRMELLNWSYVDFTMTAHSTRAAHKIKPQNANRQKRGRRLRGNRD
jgi:hypothetical protein